MFKGIFGKRRKPVKKKLCKGDNSPIDISNKRITLREICKGLGINVPKKFENIADEKSTVAFRSKYVKPGDICLIIRSAEDFQSASMTTKDQYNIAIKKGAKLIIMEKKAFKKAHLKKRKFPVILMDEADERIAGFIEKIREKQKGKVVMVTGSLGKTTTKDFCYAVTKNSFRTFAARRNSNTTHRVIQHLFEQADKEYDVYIQEAGAGYRGSVRFSSEMLRPDFFILTNIYDHHFQVYKTIENLIEDKTSADDNMSPHGIIIANYDDDRIRNHTFRHKVKSFAVENENVDFRALNIHQIAEYLCFDIYEKETGEMTAVKINILGKHNVYNGLAAFALGKCLGISTDAIQQGFLEYKAEGIRQNLINIGGVYLNMDCYNVAEESIMAMLEAGEEMELAAGASRLALIGGENKLGDNVRERSEEFGKELSRIKFDRILFCGTKDCSTEMVKKYGDAESIQNGFRKKSQIPSELCTDIEGMIKFLECNVHKNDLVMLKGIYLLNMSVAVDKVFGTSFSFGLAHYKKTMRKVNSDGYSGNMIEEMGEVELTGADIIGESLRIPDKIEDYPVFRITNRAFSGRRELKTIDLGNNVKNIGEYAFRNCKSVKNITIPSCVRVIEKGAFKGCSQLEKVVIMEGVTHIGEEAFSYCRKLKTVTIPKSVGMICKDAFKETGEIEIICEKDTYAYEYALANGICITFSII